MSSQARALFEIFDIVLAESWQTLFLELSCLVKAHFSFRAKLFENCFVVL
jgi:hypothetical protein